MNNRELYKALDIPAVVVDELNKYEENRVIHIDDSLKHMMYDRKTWDDAVKKIQELLGEDPDGIKVLWEELNLICESYDKYVEKNIPYNVFVDTMKFCTRFLGEHKRAYDTYKFVWAWWYPRQISLNEFRIGALEYELVEGNIREIYIHIPSDADLRRESVQQSIKDFDSFRTMYFPDWENVLLSCDSWLLSPALKELLDEGSNILDFQSLFEIESTEYESMWVLGWVFPGYESISDDLPEKTTLQKRMKEYLLSDKKVGSAKGYLKNI